MPRLRVAIVAPSMGILGGQAVQAERLLQAWAGDPDVTAWLAPINPVPPRWLRWSLNVKYLRTIITQILYWPLLVRELRRADIAHVFSASYFSFLLAPLPAIIVARLLGRPVILNYRSGEAPDHLKRSAVARRALASVARNVVPSRFLEEVFASFGLTAQVVPNIVDVVRFQFRHRETITPRLLSTRNFEGLYNIACTLRAFQIVQAEYPDATLTLVGAGGLDRSLRALAADLRLRNVTFAGRVQPADIWRYYAEADLYVQTPDIDNMPSSVLEAFSSGVPVVSTDAGGVPAILADGVDGLLAPLNDHEAVARQILRLLREPGLVSRLTASARQRCDQYRWTNVREQWLDVYRSVMTRRPLETEAGPNPAEAFTLAGPARRSRLARLRAMDSRELRFRARTMATDKTDRLVSFVRPPRWRRTALADCLTETDPSLGPALGRLAARDWLGAHEELKRHFQNRPPRFVLDPSARGRLVSAVCLRFPGAVEDAERRAERILSNRYDLLGYTDLDFSRTDASPGTHEPLPVNWKLDPVHGRVATDRWWSRVRFLDPENGDHKIIWELNRQQHWLALGRAYWLTGRETYRARAIAELESWLAQNPPRIGINWASMLELAFRSLSWIWALHFFVGDPLEPAEPGDTSPWLVDLLLGLDYQLRHVEENLSHYFSPNTHLTGEALALYVAGRALPEFRASRRWESVGRQVLLEQAAAQVAADGGHAERSTHYHRYTLDFYLLALAVARKTGDAAAERQFARVVERLARFAWAMADATGYLPRIGDDDAGSLMPVCGGDTSDARASLSIAASLLPDRVPVEDFTEESLWVAGPEPPADTHAWPRNAREAGHAGGGRRPAAREWDKSTAFPATGYYVSRSRTGDHLVFDAGPHGFLNGGHAHADALSIALSLRWHRFLVDAGTGTYTIDPAVRDRFRSTASHNTLVLDGRSQALPDGPFHWAAAAQGRAVRTAFNPRFDYFEGAHDGYAPVTHRRAVFSAAGELWLIVDHVLGPGRHSAAAHWHLDPDWRVRIDAPTIGAIHEDGIQAAIATTASQMDIFRGDESSGLGWCSPAYGRIISCPTVRFSRTGVAPFSLATLIVPTHRACDVSVSVVPVGGGPTGAHAYAVRVARPGLIDLALFTVPADGATPAVEPHRPIYRFGDFETDARFAHVRFAPGGPVRAVSIVDGTLVQRLDDEPFRIELQHAVRDLTVNVDATGQLELFSSAALPTLALDAPASLINRVRVNDAAASFSRATGAVIVPPAHAATGGGRVRETPLQAPGSGVRSSGLVTAPGHKPTTNG